MAKRSRLVRKLLHRDGDRCFYCNRKLNDDMTVEHLLSRSKGGREHLDNLVLSHFECNREASNRSIMEKIKMREIKMGLFMSMTD